MVVRGMQSAQGAVHTRSLATALQQSTLSSEALTTCAPAHNSVAHIVLHAYTCRQSKVPAQQAASREAMSYAPFIPVNTVLSKQRPRCCSCSRDRKACYPTCRWENNSVYMCGLRRTLGDSWSFACVVEAPVCIVTGGGRGIGKAIATMLGATGAKVLM